MIKIKYILPLIAIFVVSCASAPEESPTPPVEEPVIEQEEETVEVDPEPVIIEEPVIVEEPIVFEEEEVYVPEPLDEALLAKAKKEIFKTEEARAKTYFPSRLQDLKNKLAMATEQKESDPDKAREILKEITPQSEQLIVDSLEALKVACINILNGKTDSLLKLKADKYTSVEFETTQTQKNETIVAFDEDDLTNSLALYRVAYTSLTNLYNSLSTNMGYIDNLLRIINNKKVEGESIEVEKWAPAEYHTAVDSYTKSNKLLYEDFDAIAGELSLRETVFFTDIALQQAKINIEVAEMDAEILALMGELESASTLTVLDNEDNIITPVEWEGSAELKEKPIEAEVEKDEESGLTPINLEEEVEVEYPDTSTLKVVIEEETTDVLGMRDERISLLSEAKSLWKQGLDARNNGNLISAREFLAKSKVFLDEYKSMAVDYIYTVILNPEERDCLWRISEKEEYYNDPLLWQNIWERNKKLIQDPDLIFPGWKLIIPPIDEEKQLTE